MLSGKVIWKSCKNLIKIYFGTEWDTDYLIFFILFFFFLMSQTLLLEIISLSLERKDLK